MKSLVIIPTYNEIENIDLIIPAVLQAEDSVEILVVDDNSPDGTAASVQRLMSRYKNRLHLLSRAQKNGLGRAYLAGFQWALEQDYWAVIQMDADFSHNPDDIPKILEGLKDHHWVVGSRYVDGVNVVNWPLSRILLSYGASKYVRWITNMPIKDPTAGFNGIRMEVLKKIDFKAVKFVGYAFQIEMKYLSWKLGFKHLEIPIIFTNRKRGVSKMHGNIIWEALYGVIYLRLFKIKQKEI
ncbi:MAG: polyprenol monophosphomannose synthase [Flavobacteriaceae bacterium]